MKKTPTYLHCRNCGRFLLEEEVFARWYCSWECAGNYTHCWTCGKYFRTNRAKGRADRKQGTSTIDQDERKFCTPECAKLSPDTPGDR